MQYIVSSDIIYLKRLFSVKEDISLSMMMIHDQKKLRSLNDTKNDFSDKKSSIHSENSDLIEKKMNAAVILLTDKLK